MRKLAALTAVMMIALAGCRETTTPPTTGACCATAGTCTVTTQADCTGTWTASGVCTPNPCPQPTGSCCAPSGACAVTTQAACTGTWTLAGVCTPNPCPPPLPPVMVLIPAGTFTMGSPADELGRDSDETQHQVTLTKAVYVSKYEVAQSEWQAVMGWNESYSLGPNLPVETVTWYDAAGYCNQRSTQDGFTPVYAITGVTFSGPHIASATVAWNQAANGYRLLTEAEWEYACRAGSTSGFCNGGITNVDCSPLDPNLDQVGWYCGNASGTTHAVGGKTANAWGLHDMHGNVWEWCWDERGEYPAGPVTDPLGPETGSPSYGRVIRGGHWGYPPQVCRSAMRNNLTEPASPGEARHSPMVGLRIARNAPR